MRARSLVPFALLFVLAIEARAQSPDRVAAPDAVAAQALYDAAGDLMDAKKWDEARTKLEEALKLAPAAVGAKLRLAECLEGQGRLASAWTAYLAAESAAKTAGQTDRAARAHTAAAALEPRLSHLTVAVPAATRDLPGLAIERDATPVGPGQWSVAIPVDGGAHKIVALASGKARWERAVTVAGEGASVTIEVEGFADLPAPVPIPVPLPPAATPSIAPLPPPPIEQPRRSLPTWALVTGAGGLALGGAGLAFAIDLKSIADKQLSLCGPAIDHCERARPPYDPSADNDRKSRDYVLGLVFGGAGTALLAAGILGWVLAPSAPRTPGVTSPPARSSQRPRIEPRLWASASGAAAGLAGDLP